ncbi:MAG: dephospho-CoA kinase [Bacilli bacterium]|nr:dephospho-CoA kinase [Bacilli bacterium]
MIIGITGSIGTGKSTVTNYLKNKGYKILDADIIAKAELENQDVINELVLVLGSRILKDGKINRKLLGEIIFQDAESREKLNQIIHPRVIDKIKAQVKGENLLFVDIPLLYEAELEYLVDKVLVVYTEPLTQLKRLMKRDNIEQQYALKKISTQIDIEKKKVRADYLVNNENDLEGTHQQIELILRRIENEI